MKGTIFPCPDNTKKRVGMTVGVTVVAAAFLLVLGHNMEVATCWRPIRLALQSPAVPSPLLEYGALGAMLRRHGLVMAMPNDGKLYRVGPEDADVLGLRPFQKKRRAAAFLLQANPAGHAGFPSSSAPDPVSMSAELPCVSIWGERDAFHHPETGLMTHWEERGREWERMGYMSYFDNGRLALSSGVGLRIHGYKSNRWRRRSFRLYFRRGYGADHFAAGVLEGPPGGDIRTLVLRRDKHHKLLYVNSFAFDIIRRAGVAMPRARPVTAFLNGRYVGVYCLSEHLSRRQWRANLGHDDFDFYNKRASSSESSIRAYEDLLAWAKDPSFGMTMETVAERVEMDMTSRQLLVYMCLGLTDWQQGVAFRDRTIPGARWSWITWDLDNSLVNLRKGKAHVDWRFRAVSLVLGEKWLVKRKSSDLEGASDARRVLFCRLWDECPEYRRSFLRQATDLLNHRISKRFLLDRWQWYMATMDSIGAHPTSEMAFRGLESYFLNRHRFLMEDLRAHADAGKIVTCTIIGPAGSEYRIDGYPEPGEYRGMYYVGQSISVEPVDRDGPSIHAWLVNGRHVPGTKLSVVVDKDMVIEPVFDGESDPDTDV